MRAGEVVGLERRRSGRRERIKTTTTMHDSVFIRITAFSAIKHAVWRMRRNAVCSCVRMAWLGERMIGRKDGVTDVLVRGGNGGGVGSTVGDPGMDEELSGGEAVFGVLLETALQECLQIF